ncbi:MAG: helix-turn-helix transcriptional regulator [Chloroflexi bacterium]|nr:helix-turn-helix transcriptional regulator [Chloroflexota bacterium]
MNYKDYFKKLEGDAEYQEAEQELKFLLDLADDVLRLRMEKGWSQAELAERAGTKQANISRLESGLSNPSVNFLQKVAKALNTNVSVHFERSQTQEFYIFTNYEYQSKEAIPLPANWPSFKQRTQSTNGITSATIRQIYD